MVETFDTINARQRARKREQDCTDFNNEMAGNETGRIKRFFTSTDTEKVHNQKQREKSALERLLMNAEYFQAYNDVIDALYDAQNAVDLAINEALENLRQSQQAYDDMLAQASELPNGTKVFLDDNGLFYTLRGRELTEHETYSVNVGESTLTPEQAIKICDTLKQDTQRYNHLMGLQDRIHEINDGIHKNDQPFSLEELGTLKNELDTITNSLEITSLANDRSPADLSITAVPDLKF